MEEYYADYYTGYPRVLATVDGFVNCPYCKGVHRHGGMGNGIAGGHRHPDCGNMVGYVVVPYHRHETDVVINFPPQSKTVRQRLKEWLITRTWLWKKVVFDNGVCGKNFVRYDHRILSYCEGMGDNGADGSVSDAIKRVMDLREAKVYSC